VDGFGIPASEKPAQKATTHRSKPARAPFLKVANLPNFVAGSPVFNKGETHAHKTRICRGRGLRDLQPCGIYRDGSVCPSGGPYDR